MPKLRINYRGRAITTRSGREMDFKNGVINIQAAGYNGAHIIRTCVLDVLWCQPIKLIHVVSTSEFHEY